MHSLMILVALLLAGCETTANPSATMGPDIVPITVPPPSTVQADSYGSRVFYEAWVRSVQDSDGDGIGDLKGMIQRIPDLAALGIGGIWLMPTFPSPLADSGYDVADYTAVHPDYGTLENLSELIRVAHEHNILIYLDMVFNHVSNEHVWFQSALTGPASPYYDYFVWADEPMTRCTDVPAGPFGTVRWTYSDDAGKYYFHQFYPRQPDLNYRSPALRQALLDVLNFWMDRGVDGFRFDVPDRFYENGNHCSHQPETVEFHEKLRETIVGRGRSFVTEIWGTVESNRPFFEAGNPMIFNFELLFSLYTGALAGASAEPIREAVAAMLADLPATGQWGILIGNHDVPRPYEIAGGDMARLRLAAALQLTLPGVPFMWMGEELGLPPATQVRVDFRDKWRAPYPWTEQDDFGFGSTTPHLAFGPYAGMSYATQTADPGSLLNHYRAWIGLRNATPALHAKDYRDLGIVGDIWSYQRGTGAEHVVVAHNFARRTRANAQRSGYSDILGNCSDLGPGDSCAMAPAR